MNVISPETDNLYNLQSTITSKKSKVNFLSNFNSILMKIKKEILKESIP